MDITQVKIFPVHEDKLKAFVSVVFDHCFMVNDIKVIQGKDGLFLSMPSRRKKSGEFKDVAHPLNNETRRMLEEKVLSEYRTVADDLTPRRPDRPEEAVDNGAEKGPKMIRPAVGGDEGHAAPAPFVRPAAASHGEPVRQNPNPGSAARGKIAPIAAVPPRAADGNGHGPQAIAASGSKAEGQGVGGSGVAASSAGADEEKTLEEVQEMHLSDSFWTVS